MIVLASLYSLSMLLVESLLTIISFLNKTFPRLSSRKTVEQPKMDLFSSPRAEVIAVPYFVVALVTVVMATHRKVNLKKTDK